VELALLALVLTSTGMGVVCRTRVRPSTGRLLLAAGVTALVLGLLILGLPFIEWGFATWTAGLVSVVLLTVAALVLPFAVAVGMGRKGK
jgi:hypothetical protein